MRLRATIAPLALMLAAVCPSSGLAQSEGMPWRTDFKAAQAEAEQSGKLLLVHFWTETCGPCRLLDKRVFSQPSVATAIGNEYIPVKINATEHPELAQAYRITRVPTDAVVTPQGQLVKAFVSPATPMEYVSVVTRLAGAYRTQAGGAYAAAAAAAPNPNVTTPQGNLATQEQPPTAGGFNQAYAQLMASSPAPQAAAPQAATQPAAVASNPYASAPSQVAAAQPQPTPSAPAVTANRYAPITPIAATAPAVAPQQTQPETKSAATPQLPPGSPPLGFEGYCAVTMKKEWRWAKGDARFGAIHRGRTYLFTSAEAQQTFLASPDNYSPVLAGSDAVAAVDGRQSVPGVRDFAVEFEGRFYLFANEQSLEKFWSDPKAYAAGAQRVAALPAGSSFIR